MDNTFTRALLGFILLTSALALMAFFALWGITQYGGGSSWAAIIVVILALVAEIGIYSTTLHDPIYDWVREPDQRRRTRDYDIERAESRITGLEREAKVVTERIRVLEQAVIQRKRAGA